MLSQAKQIGTRLEQQDNVCPLFDLIDFDCCFAFPLPICALMLKSYAQKDKILQIGNTKANNTHVYILFKLKM